MKWYHVKRRYGFITRDDNGQDVFVHQSHITQWNMSHSVPSLDQGERVEFGIDLTPMPTAINVTGPAGKEVRGSRFAALRHTKKKKKPASRSPIAATIPAVEDEPSSLSVLPFQRSDRPKHQENCAPLSPRGKVQRPITSPSSSECPSQRPSTSTSTATSD